MESGGEGEEPLSPVGVAITVSADVEATNTPAETKQETGNEENAVPPGKGGNTCPISGKMS